MSRWEIRSEDGSMKAVFEFKKQTYLNSNVNRRLRGNRRNSVNKMLRNSRVCSPALRPIRRLDYEPLRFFFNLLFVFAGTFEDFTVLMGIVFCGFTSRGGISFWILGSGSWPAGSETPNPEACPETGTLGEPIFSASFSTFSFSATGVGVGTWLCNDVIL